MKNVQTYNPNEETLQAVTLTEPAKVHLRTQIANNKPHAIGLNFGVKVAGCTGYKYVISLALEKNDNALSFPIDANLSVFVEKESYPFVKGTVIDFKKQGLNTQFTYHNPNVKDACGCGESFNIDLGDDGTL